MSGSQRLARGCEDRRGRCEDPRGCCLEPGKGVRGRTRVLRGPTRVLPGTWQGGAKTHAGAARKEESAAWKEEGVARTEAGKSRREAGDQGGSRVPRRRTKVLPEGMRASPPGARSDHARRRLRGAAGRGEQGRRVRRRAASLQRIVAGSHVPRAGVDRGCGVRWSRRLRRHPPRRPASPVPGGSDRTQGRGGDPVDRGAPAGRHRLRAPRRGGRHLGRRVRRPFALVLRLDRRRQAAARALPEGMPGSW